MDSLPTPAEDGLIRVTAALRIGDDGSATIESIEDIPLPSEDREEESETPEMLGTQDQMDQLQDF